MAATVVSDLLQSYDQSDTNFRSVAPGVHMISPVDTPLQLMLRKVQGFAVLEEWIEDELISQESALSSTVSDTTGTEITVSTDDCSGIIPEDVDTYNVVIRIDSEYMLVTAESSGVLTVTRGYGSTTAATHASGAVIHVISQLETEGADGKKAQATVRTSPGNYHQTFSRTIEVSGVQEAVRHLGGVTSELQYDMMAAARALAKELEKTLILGVTDAAGDATTPRTMGGLWHMISTNRTTDSGSIDSDAIEADIETIWAAGGNPNLLITTGKLAQDISNIYADRIRTDVINTVGGVAVTTLVDVLLGNGPMYVLPHRMVPAGEYYMCTLDKMALTFLRPFFVKPLAEDGDSLKRWIGGDYSLMLMNEEAHAYRSGFDE